ncbi:MAG: hypothetical protein FWG30_12065 [Eubacteriaceae bacterium]|nr:hypothetical protein [Eubacteriaceae bacterium]
MPGIYTEPDIYDCKIEGELDAVRIYRDGVKYQRGIIEVLASQVFPFRNYILKIRQPIPIDVQGLPLFIKVIDGRGMFAPDVSVGYGYEFGEEMEDNFAAGGVSNFDGGCHDCEGFEADGMGVAVAEKCETEIIEKVIEARIFPVIAPPNGNQAFGDELVNLHCGNVLEPKPYIKLYRNDRGDFVLKRHVERACCRPKRVVLREKRLTIEPKTYNAIGIGTKIVPYAYPQRYESFDYLVEGSTACAPAGRYGGYGGYGGRW